MNEKKMKGILSAYQVKTELLCRHFFRIFPKFLEELFPRQPQTDYMFFIRKTAFRFKLNIFSIYMSTYGLLNNWLLVLELGLVTWIEEQSGTKL